MTLWDIYGIAFKDVLPAVQSLNPLRAEDETGNGARVEGQSEDIKARD